MIFNEATKIIAQFMGETREIRKFDNDISYYIDMETHYTTLESVYNFYSLDKLIPVWEKLGVKNISINKGINSAEGMFFIQLDNIDGGENTSLQVSAVLATARYIEEKYGN